MIRIGLPTYAIPYHKQYDVGGGAFTVAAVASFLGILLAYRWLPG